MDKELGEIRERRIVSVRAGGERSAGPGSGVSSALTFGGRWGGGEVSPPPSGRRVWMVDWEFRTRGGEVLVTAADPLPSLGSP